MTSRRLSLIEESATLAIAKLASELEGMGNDVITMSLGEPDFDTPEYICKSAFQSIRRGETHYTPVAGISELKNAIVEKLRSENKLDAAPDQILVTPGAKQAVFQSVQAVLDEGDEAILLDPAWVSYDACIRYAGARTVWAPTDQDFMPPDIGDYVTNKTKLIIINSPGNPSGAVFGKKHLEDIAEIAIDNDITVLSDEIYEKIIYDKKHYSIGSFDEMHDRVITINGFSKSYAMTGWRLGYMAAPPDIVRAALKLQSHSVSHAASFVQHAGVTALRIDHGSVDSMVAEFRARRDILVDGLKSLGFNCTTPAGAFYLFLDVTDYGGGDAVAERLLEEAYIAVTPGSAFGPESSGFIRISYAASRERIYHALTRIRDTII
ncbi:MAG TPA: pyridoxal phosphate-dependent aminotransferase [Methanosarcinales archaeon]|nr:pyridoxal phosphate-dependent aminotransferase [Methanosarcinales archaeon]